MSSSAAVAVARIRIPALVLVVVALLLEARLRLLPVPYLVVWVAGMVLIVALMRIGSLDREPVPLRVPVTGRWAALNSPTTRVPSHGIQNYGQTYALDLCADPSDRTRPGFGWWPIARRPDAFPGFGAPVHAPCDGAVVSAHDAERDHWSRTSPLALGYMLTVEQLRELFGPAKVLGNHVILDRGDGNYALLAHLRRDSITVRTGQQVRAGDLVAACGNSGNSSEPHLHLQVMEHRRPMVAAGVPICFTDPGGAPIAVPGNGAHLSGPHPVAPLPATPQSPSSRANGG